MKKFFKIRKVRAADLAAMVGKRMRTACDNAGVTGVRHLELAVRSLNLQRTP